MDTVYAFRLESATSRCNNVGVTEPENDLEPLHGLVDARRAAALLGVPRGTFVAWVARKHDWLPRPVGRLSGMVWDAEEIRALAERGIPVRPPGPRPRPKK